jgi:hypothetical protein
MKNISTATAESIGRRDCSSPFYAGFGDGQRRRFGPSLGPTGPAALVNRALVVLQEPATI